MARRAKPNKYDHVLAATDKDGNLLLQRLPPEDADKQERVNALKRTCPMCAGSGGDINNACQACDGSGIVDRRALRLGASYAGLRHQKENLQLQLSLLELKIEAYEQLLEESKESKAPGWGDYGVKDNALILPSGEIVRVRSQPYGSVNDTEAFRLWCIANGYERKLQLHHSTMNTIVKERLLLGQDPPKGCGAFRNVTIVLDKKRGKEHEDTDD